MCYHMQVSLDRTTRHSDYNLNYHLVAVPKYRRRVLIGVVRDRLIETINALCAERDWTVLGLEVMPDHIHLFISCPPKWSPSDMAKIVKGVTARALLQEFPALRARNGSLWTSAFYVGTAGSVSSETIRKYIAAQQERD
jgi:putative transposase